VPVRLLYTDNYILILKCGSNIVKTDTKLDIKWIKLKLKLKLKFEFKININVFIANITNSI
jgi:hypothetical protein